MAGTSETVERTLSILEIAAHSKNGLTNSDISRRLSIPKSSASNILRVLENRGFLAREKDTNRYRLGLKLMGLTRETTAHLDVREIARPVMEEFVRKTNLSIHLAILDNGRAVYIEKVEAESFIKMDIWVGHRLPVHTTAIGKALAANLQETEVVRILDLRGMEKHTARTITSQSRFLKELEKVRKHGFAIDDEENSQGVRCVATPVFDAQGKAIAALGISDTITRLDDAHLAKAVESVKAAAARISNLLGFETAAKKTA